MIEESRVKGMVCGDLNATILTLITKNDRPETFQDFRPIALCNVVYKMITRIIANRLKPMLSKFIAKEQFGFLENRYIIEAIGVAQEGLHNIKVRKHKSLVLKHDLIKAYDGVN